MPKPKSTRIRHTTPWIWTLPLCLAMATPVLAGNAEPLVYGKTIGNWGHAWWAWLVNFSAADAPALQDGEVDCAAGQSGAVWFLAGTFGGTVERRCTVPKNRTLFFPIANSLFFSPEDGITEIQLRHGVGQSADAVRFWTCTLDGIPCVWSHSIVRAQSDLRPIDFSVDSFVVTEFGFNAGRRDMSVADGNWVMLGPLRVGTHTLHFTAADAANPSEAGFALDVTYELTVE